MKLERLYRIGQVYNHILDTYYKFMVPPALLNAGATIVFSSYVTARHTELPLYIYWMFPYISVSYSLITFDLCYDGILTIRASEGSLGLLRSKEKQYFRGLSVEERRFRNKTAMALRPVFFNVGDFADYDDSRRLMELPITVWDEMLNQLLFLLTL